MELPKHIADMCGVVVDAKTASALPTEKYNAVKALWDDADQVMTISYRDSVVGWVTDTKSEHWPQYLALSVNGQVNRFFTQSLAMNWLIEESF